jgi:flagellin
MSLGVLNNIAAMYAENNLNQTQNSLQNTLTQLSSGSRINSGSDDAAGLAVADGLQANEAALTQSSQNANAGVSMLQTADGALSQVNNLLNRAVTLATEAANGTLNTNQVSAANQEYQNILTEIGNIGSTTNFNSNSVFSSNARNIVVSDGTSSGTTTFADTIGALTTASVGEAPGTTTVTPGTGTAETNPTPTTSSSSAASVATFAGAVAVGGTISGAFSVAVGSGTAVTGTLAAGTTLANAVTQLNAAFTTASNGVVASIGAGNKLVLTGPVAASSDLVLTGTSLTATTASTSVTTATGGGVDFTASSVATLTASSAQTVLTSLTTAIGDVAYQRGIIGADVNQLNAASNVASSESVNLTSASSSIMSTDYGQATSDMAKYQVLSQTGISALAQANSVQQEVLKLLQ